MPDRGASTAALLEGFKPEGDMEAEVAALLEGAGAAGAAAMAEAERALGEQVGRAGGGGTAGARGPARAREAAAPLAQCSRGSRASKTARNGDEPPVKTTAPALCQPQPPPTAPNRPTKWPPPLNRQGLSPEEHKERAARLARMRSVLFYAEQKAKRCGVWGGRGAGQGRCEGESGLGEGCGPL